MAPPQQGNTPVDAVVLTDPRVSAFLRDRFHGDVGGVSLVRPGEWSVAYGFRRDGSDYIVRFSRLCEDFQKDRLAARYASGALPIPPIIEAGEALGGFYAISPRVAGEHLDGLDEAGMRHVLPSLFAALDAARTADLSQTTGYGLWDAEGTGRYPSWRASLLDAGHDGPEDRTHGWREGLAASPTGLKPFRQAFERLQALVEHAPEERHLVHSDLLHYNILVADGRITAVLDWGSSTYGDFLYDLAWLCFWAPWYPAWGGIDFLEEALGHYASTGLEVPYFEERLRCCQIDIGLRAQAYSAFKRRWGNVEAAAGRTLEVAGH